MTWPGTGESSTVTSHDRVNLPCVCRTSWTDLFCGARNACGDVSYRIWLAPSSCTCSAKPCHACWDRGHGRKLAPHAVHPQIPKQRKHRLEPLKSHSTAPDYVSSSFFARSHALHILVRGSSASQQCAFPCNGCPSATPSSKPLTLLLA
jgi:hypothetical protein